MFGLRSNTPLAQAGRHGKYDIGPPQEPRFLSLDLLPVRASKRAVFVIAVIDHERRVEPLDHVDERRVPHVQDRLVHPEAVEQMPDIARAESLEPTVERRAVAVRQPRRWYKAENFGADLGESVLREAVLTQLPGNVAYVRWRRRHEEHAAARREPRQHMMAAPGQVRPEIAGK